MSVTEIVNFTFFFITVVAQSISLPEQSRNSLFNHSVFTSKLEMLSRVAEIRFRFLTVKIAAGITRACLYRAVVVAECLSGFEERTCV